MPPTSPAGRSRRSSASSGSRGSSSSPRTRAPGRRFRRRSRRWSAPGSELNRYPDGGCVRLQEALAARHGVGAEQVCAGAGADGCLDLLSQAVLGPGDEVVCGWPSFASYPIYAAKQGAVTVKVPLTDHRYDLEALLAAISPRTKIVYVCHPNNPTGTMNTREELDAFLERVPAGVLVVIDQAYFEYVGRADYPDAIREYVAAGRRVARAAHVLEDLRPRRAQGRLRGRARRRLRGDGEGPPSLRPVDDGAGGGAREPLATPTSSTSGGS